MGQLTYKIVITKRMLQQNKIFKNEIKNRHEVNRNVTQETKPGKIRTIKEKIDDIPS